MSKVNNLVNNLMVIAYLVQITNLMSINYILIFKEEIIDFDDLENNMWRIVK